jgi:hypothetical protein
VIEYPPVDCQEVSHERLAYRFVHVAEALEPGLAADFQSDRASGKRPIARERRFPELQDGMSMYGSLTAARGVWNDIAAFARSQGQPVRAGNYVAEVALRPGFGFQIEDLGEIDEHLTIWGHPDALAGSVVAIYPAAREED